MRGDVNGFGRLLLPGRGGLALEGVLGGNVVCGSCCSCTKSFAMYGGCLGL